MKVLAENSGTTVMTEIRIDVVDDADLKVGVAGDEMEVAEEEEEELSKILPEYTFLVKENLKGALVANLSGLEITQKREIGNGGSNSEFFITKDDDAKAKFSVTDSGLLYTKVGGSKTMRIEVD